MNVKRITEGRTGLALVSFVSLFLELVIIRWLATEVRIFAYFKNLPLFAAFLGLGAGYIVAPARRNYFRYAPLFLFATVLAIALAPRFGYTHIVFTDPYEYYLIGAWAKPNLGAALRGLGILAGIFVLVVSLFAALGEKVGALLDAAKPLPAYSINIAAGLTGVFAYTLLCYLRTGPTVWLLVVILPLIPFFLAHSKHCRARRDSNRRSDPAIRQCLVAVLPNRPTA